MGGLQASKLLVICLNIYPFNQNNQMSEAQAQRLVEKAVSRIKKEDIVHRGFLKPIQIALKTFKSEQLEEDTKLKPGSLPAGLKIALKASPGSDVHFLEDIEEIQQNQTYREIKERNQDNMLALMKSKEGLELAICVCMYSEDKKMLKSTLAGVAQNIANFVAMEGMDPDKIGVFVLMDGIQKVDSSIADYFEELERSCNINLGTNIAPSLSVPELAKRTSTMSEQQINEEEMKNVNNFLFDVAELQQRNRLRFQAMKQDYNEKRKLLDVINNLKKGKPLYQDLPTSLHRFFLAEARKQRRIDYNQPEEEVNKIPAETILDEYSTDVRRMRPLVGNTLRAADNFCKSFLSEKDDLAYLAYFRRKVRFSVKHITQSNSNPSDNQENTLNQEIEHPEPHTVMNLFLCVKYKNSGKLSSHNWFFNGFCKELRPKSAILLDVGLKPDGQALVKMYKYMKDHPNVGGVCGYMSLKIEKTEEYEELKDQQVDCLTSFCTKFVDIQRTQQVEYHFAHLMDKPFEAAFGFIHVLPGAFSAYNMSAIINYDAKEDDQLLQSYFKSIDEKLANRKVVNTQISAKNALLRTLFPDFINSCCITIEPDSDEAMLYDQNVYLAEDRILCMGIHKKGFDMAFLPDAYAFVDPIKTVHGLLGQRKRWINGSFFAFEKVKRQLSLHQKQNGCQCMLNLQIMYLTLMNSLTYFSPSLFLFTVHIAMEAFREDVLVRVLTDVITNPDKSEFYNAFVYTMDFIYVMLIGTIVFYSLHLTNNHKKFKPYIYAVSTVFGLFMICVFAVLFVDILRGLLDNATFLIQNRAIVEAIPGGINTVNIMRWVLVGSIAIYLLPISIYLLLFGGLNILCEIILGSISFLFYGPTYLNILNIYSLCRIDDISWGTKGLDSTSAKNSGLKESWKMIKFVHVSKYVIWNVVVATTLLTLGANYIPRFFVTFALVGIIGASMSIKVLVGVLYMLSYWCRTVTFSSKTPVLNTGSRIDRIIESYQPEIMQQVRDNLNNIKQEYISNAYLGSFIQAARSRNSIERSYSKQRQLLFKRSGSLERQFSISRKFSKEPPSPMTSKPVFTQDRFAQKQPVRNDPFPKKPDNRPTDYFHTIREEQNDYSHSDKQLLSKQGTNIYNLDSNKPTNNPQNPSPAQNRPQPQNSSFQPQSQNRSQVSFQPQPQNRPQSPFEPQPQSKGPVQPQGFQTRPQSPFDRPGQSPVQGQGPQPQNRQLYPFQAPNQGQNKPQNVGFNPQSNESLVDKKEKIASRIPFNQQK